MTSWRKLVSSTYGRILSIVIVSVITWKLNVVKDVEIKDEELNIN
jgi:hypothetical protein